MLELFMLAAFMMPQPTCDSALLDAISYVESRHNTFAISPAGAIGVLQVIPRWSRYPRFMLFIPAFNRVEGCRILKRWQRRAKGNLKIALRAYNGGNVGLRGECSKCDHYANAVLARLSPR